MLRISVIESPETSPPVTAELGDACERPHMERRRLTLDLGDVSLIDRPGLAPLADLSRSVTWGHRPRFP